MKKIFLGLLTLQLLFSCSKDEEVINETPVSDLLNAPYSSLSPEQQKLKLEEEAKSTLTQFEKTKTSSTIKAIQNFDRLLKIYTIDIANGQMENGIQEVLHLSNAYGTYIWDNSLQVWAKTNSTTALTFKFPSKEGITVNDTELVFTATSSNIKVKIEDTPERYQYVYNPNTGIGSYQLVSTLVQDQLYLPSSLNAKIKIGGIEVGSIDLKNTFGTANEVPLTTSFKLQVNDGYSLNINTNKENAKSTVAVSLNYNNKSILTYNVDSTANIDKLLEKNQLTSYYGKANSMLGILDNFVILGDFDFASFEEERIKIQNSITYPQYNTSTYYSISNANRKKESMLIADASNKYTKLALVSKKDKTKIADVITKSELGYSYYNYLIWKDGYWQYSPNSLGQKVEFYDQVYYLKFNDNTQVAMNVYFSTGFDSLKSKIEDFVNAFN